VAEDLVALAGNTNGVNIYRTGANFTPVYNQSLEYLDLPVGKTNVAWMGIKLYYEVFATNASGEPTGAALASSSVNANHTSTLYPSEDIGFIRYPVSPSLALTGGTTYAFVFRVDDVSTQNFYFYTRYNTTGRSVSGRMLYSLDDGVTWTVLDGRRTLYYRTNVQATAIGGFPYTFPIRFTENIGTRLVTKLNISSDFLTENRLR
jgi:hypothetical protein